uniref:EF-hand domain-containing protein n=2 Tax=Chrysotila carterae TaxID=13221 RepID=A0A7S4EV38_CHRCT|mmetsp:Transcript_14126/g.29809  ORF Transcript_14126/g.29809 Transcript_14126/m.29809 type:complete len:515 (+) Transcript_14126:310-1854(+)
MRAVTAAAVLGLISTPLPHRGLPSSTAMLSYRTVGLHRERWCTAPALLTSKTTGKPRHVQPAMVAMAEDGMRSLLKAMGKRRRRGGRYALEGARSSPMALTASTAVMRRGRGWKAIFDELDIEPADGLLGADELRSAVREIAPNKLPDRVELEQLITRFDLDGDGRLNFDEFATMVESLLQIPFGSLAVRSRSFVTPERYTTRTLWFSSVWNILNSQVLRNIIQPLLAVTFTSIIVALTRSAFPGVQAGKSLVQMHSLLGGALSLLLVFRTNSAYNRFWEARQIWEKILNRCRDLGRFIHMYRAEAGEPRVARFVQLLCAYPECLRRHLCGQPRLDGVSTAAKQQLKLSKPILSALRRSKNRPLYVCKRLAAELRCIPEAAMFSSRERLMALKMINQLSDYIGACERLLQTPVPLNYARHTSRFLTLWCLTLPVSLVGSMGLLVVPVTVFVTWCLFGIQEIGLFIEHCALDDGRIFMDMLTDQVIIDVLEAVTPDDPPLDHMETSDSEEQNDDS